MKKLRKVILFIIKLQSFSYSPQRKQLLGIYCKSSNNKANLLWQKSQCEFPAPNKMITCQFRSSAGIVCLQFLQLTGPASTMPINNWMDWKQQKQFQGVPTKSFWKRGKYLFLLFRKPRQKQGAWAAFWPWGAKSVFSSRGQVMRTCCWHSCGGKIHCSVFIPTAEAETGRCLWLFVTVFHAEQQVLIKKATFTTNIHLSCRDQVTVWAHSTEKSTFPFSGGKRQSEGINMLPQANFLLSKLHLFNFSNTEDHRAPRKACLPRFHSGIKWSRRGLNKRVEVLEILVPSKAQIYECLFSQWFKIT